VDYRLVRNINPSLGRGVRGCDVAGRGLYDMGCGYADRRNPYLPFPEEGIAHGHSFLKFHNFN
jgi:hypothetical protein